MCILAKTKERCHNQDEEDCRWNRFRAVDIRYVSKYKGLRGSWSHRLSAGEKSYFQFLEEQ
jgi:hypothetical protein